MESQYSNDSDMTFCEEAEHNIHNRLLEIEENIRAHFQQKVFLTKSQMKCYRDILMTIVSLNWSKAQRRLADKLLGELNEIERNVEEFEKIWFASLSTDEDLSGFPCSLLTNQDFVSQREAKSQINFSKNVDSQMEIGNGAAGTEETKENIAQQPIDEAEVINQNLQKAVKLIRNFKVNLLRDLVALESCETMSFESTTTVLVESQYKLTPEEEARNREIIFQIQMEAKKWEKRSQELLE